MRTRCTVVGLGKLSLPSRVCCRACCRACFRAAASPWHNLAFRPSCLCAATNRILKNGARGFSTTSCTPFSIAVSVRVNGAKGGTHDQKEAHLGPPKKEVIAINIQMNMINIRGDGRWNNLYSYKMLWISQHITSPCK